MKCFFFQIRRSAGRVPRVRKRKPELGPFNYTCVACSRGKLIIKPSFTKVTFESPSFLERIQGDICGPIHPPSGHFRYFMV